MEDIKNLVNAAEGEHILNECSKFQINYGPYGPEKIKMMDFAFKSIIENMLCGMTKLTLYSLDKDIPATKVDFERYAKMKKFQRHEKYPDPLVRSFIELILEKNLSSDQYQDLIHNQFK